MKTRFEMTGGGQELKPKLSSNDRVGDYSFATHDGRRICFL